MKAGGSHEQKTHLFRTRTRGVFSCRQRTGSCHDLIPARAVSPWPCALSSSSTRIKGSSATSCVACVVFPVENVESMAASASSCVLIFELEMPLTTSSCQERSFFCGAVSADFGCRSERRAWKRGFKLAQGQKWPPERKNTSFCEANICAAEPRFDFQEALGGTTVNMRI